MGPGPPLLTLLVGFPLPSALLLPPADLGPSLQQRSSLNGLPSPVIREQIQWEHLLTLFFTSLTSYRLLSYTSPLASSSPHTHSLPPLDFPPCCSLDLVFSVPALSQHSLTLRILLKSHLPRSTFSGRPLYHRPLTIVFLSPCPHCILCSANHHLELLYVFDGSLFCLCPSLSSKLCQRFCLSCPWLCP